MSIAASLFRIANDLSRYTNSGLPEIGSLIAAANDVGKAWSGSWFGYHSRVYYQGFVVPPPGARFSQEWGFMDTFRKVTLGNWAEFRFDDVIAVINEVAGNPDIEAILALGSEAGEVFEQAKSSD